MKKNKICPLAKICYESKNPKKCQGFIIKKNDSKKLLYCHGALTAVIE